MSLNTAEQFEGIWQSVCQTVKTYEDVSSSQVDAFFSRMHIEAMSTDFIMISTDTEFIKDWVSKYYIEYINRALVEMFGTNFTVRLEETGEKPTTAPSPTPVQTATSVIQQQPTKPQIEEPPVPKVEVVEDNTFHSDNIAPLTFANFVIGDSNKMAYRMALAVAETPGKKVGLNPLFIYGKSGLGKTHLLRAIQNHVIEMYPQLKVIYVDSAEFLDDYTEASASHDRNKRSFSTFKNRYEEADVLLIDDVQFFQGKKGTLDNMFQIFNKLTNKGSQVVLSADRAPKNIDIDERYRSRFLSGGTFDIQPPDIETKLSIIKSYIEEYRSADPSINLHISAETQNFIAENSSSNIRELKGAVTAVIEHMIIDPDISMEGIKQLLQNHFTGGPMKRLTIADIQNAVEGFYHVKHSDLVGKKRSQNIAYPRQMGIYLCRELLDDIPFKQIGEAFGRDHSTAMYACKNMKQKMEDSREVEEEFEALQQIIRER